MHPPLLNFLRGLAALAAALYLGPAQAIDVAASGNLVDNTDVVRIDFVLAAPGSVTLWTDSWMAGLNFDPELALFDSNFLLVTVGDDTPDPAALLPGQGGYDSQIRIASLAAGSYHLALTASGNDPLGPNYGAGFSLGGTTPIPIALWNQPGYDVNHDDQKGSAWSVHLDGITAVPAVPEPANWVLFGAGLGVVFLAIRRRRND